MRSLRYAYVLALVVWLGGMTAAGLVVAPVTFGVLEAWNPSTGRVLAGDVFGAVLARLNVIGYAAGAVMFLLGPRPRAYGVRVALIASMVLLTMYVGLIAAPRIDELQAAVTGPLQQLSTDDARRIEFDWLHRLSTSMTLATILAGLVLLGWETRE
jgi:hypothetical protein